MNNLNKQYVNVTEPESNLILSLYQRDTLSSELARCNCLTVTFPHQVWLLVVGVKADCLTRDLSQKVECLPWGAFLRDPNPYLRKFRRKPRKTPNGQVDQHDLGMNLAPPVYQLLSAATAGAQDGQLDINALPGIRTRDNHFLDLSQHVY